jgi:hypothetical protein
MNPRPLSSPREGVDRLDIWGTWGVTPYGRAVLLEVEPKQARRVAVQTLAKKSLLSRTLARF